MSELGKLRIRLSARENFSTAIALIAVIALIQVVIIWFFYSHGLTDPYLFTLIPAGVVTVLTSNWIYLTEKLATIPKAPRKPSPSKPSVPSSIFKSHTMEITVKSAIITFAPFIILTIIAFSLPALTRFLAWLQGVAPPQISSFTESMHNSLISFRMTAPVWKYIYLETFSAVASTLVTLFVGGRH